MESLCISVPRTNGEQVLKKLIGAGVLDKRSKIKQCGENLLFPVLEAVEGYGEIGKENFELRRNKPALPQGAYEFIGEIAIIDRYEENANDIAEALLKHKNIKTVFQATGAVSGEFRTRELVIIAGEKKTETLHRENGCRYLMDVTQVYFTPRLSTERARIADQVREGDRVVDMFAGIGPFSILIAKKFPHAFVFAIDKNPAAIKYLRENARINKVKNLDIREGDVRDEAKGILEVDHLIMNLPHAGLDFLDCAFGMIKKGSTIHFYAISHENDLFNGKLQNIQERANGAGFSLASLGMRIVRPYAPHQYNICIDIRVL